MFVTYQPTADQQRELPCWICLLAIFPPFAKTISWQHLRDFNKNFNQSKKWCQVDYSVLFLWWWNFEAKLLLSDWGFGRIGPMTAKCVTQKDSEKAHWGDQAPEPVPHHCCTYLLGLLNHYELHTRRFSFQPSQLPGHLTSGRTVYLASRSPFAKSGCVFQFISCDPVERGLRKRKLSLKQS